MVNSASKDGKGWAPVARRKLAIGGADLRAPKSLPRLPSLVLFATSMNISTINVLHLT
jgi:hypothetical protein